MKKNLLYAGMILPLMLAPMHIQASSRPAALTIFRAEQTDSLQEVMKTDHVVVKVGNLREDEEVSRALTVEVEAENLTDQTLTLDFSECEFPGAGPLYAPEKLKLELELGARLCRSMRFMFFPGDELASRLHMAALIKVSGQGIEEHSDLVNLYNTASVSADGNMLTKPSRNPSDVDLIGPAAQSCEEEGRYSPDMGIVRDDTGEIIYKDENCSIQIVKVNAKASSPEKGHIAFIGTPVKDKNVTLKALAIRINGRNMKITSDTADISADSPGKDGFGFEAGSINLDEELHVEMDLEITADGNTDPKLDQAEELVSTYKSGTIRFYLNNTPITPVNTDEKDLVELPTWFGEPIIFENKDLEVSYNKAWILELDDKNSVLLLDLATENLSREDLELSASEVLVNNHKVESSRTFFDHAVEGLETSDDILMIQVPADYLTEENRVSFKLVGKDGKVLSEDAIALEVSSADDLKGAASRLYREYRKVLEVIQNIEAELETYQENLKVLTGEMLEETLPGQAGEENPGIGGNADPADGTDDSDDTDDSRPSEDGKKPAGEKDEAEKAESEASETADAEDIEASSEDEKAIMIVGSSSNSASYNAGALMKQTMVNLNLDLAGTTAAELKEQIRDARARLAQATARKDMLASAYEKLTGDTLENAETTLGLITPEAESAVRIVMEQMQTNLHNLQTPPAQSANEQLTSDVSKVLEPGIQGGSSDVFRPRMSETGAVAEISSTKNMPVVSDIFRPQGQPLGVTETAELVTMANYTPTAAETSTSFWQMIMMVSGLSFVLMLGSKIAMHLNRKD